MDSGGDYTELHDEKKSSLSKTTKILITIGVLLCIGGAITAAVIVTTKSGSKTNSGQVATTQSSIYTNTSTNTSSANSNSNTTSLSSNTTTLCCNITTPCCNTTITNKGTLPDNNTWRSIPDLFGSDGTLGNPNAYPNQNCTHVNYVSYDGKIFLRPKDGTSDIPMFIKGVSWFGMETEEAIPLGLWDNGNTGTTAYNVAKFLYNNNFNSVRLPLCIQSILQNTVPNQNLINTYTNKAINVSDYMSLLKSLIVALGYREITVMISLHTLVPSSKDSLWYSTQIPESSVLSAVDILTSNLCSSTYWNVIGIDVKNEPYAATWGDGSSSDFRIGAERIGNRMLNGCANWLVFVQGVYGYHTFTKEGKTFSYADWWGGGLKNAGTYPVQLSVPDKLVYAPHYYPSSVYPQPYLYGANWTELSDADLYQNVRLTMDDMFGYLVNETTASIILGEFGGLYTTDKHPQKTTQRVIQDNIDLTKRQGFSGGYVWSLNPESLYNYNPFNTPGNFTEGLLGDDWITPNQPYLDALSKYDGMLGLTPFFCIPSQ